MTGVRISQLPTATTPLTGTELIPVVQGGVTKQTTIGGTLPATQIVNTPAGVLAATNVQTAVNELAVEKPQTVTDIAALRLLNISGVSRPTQVVLLQNYTAGDGGGIFRLDTTDIVSADNGGTTIVDAAGNRWKRQFSGSINIKWFGAVGDGVADDVTAIQAAIDYIESLNGGVIILPQGTYKITATLNMNASVGVQLIGQGSDGIHDGGTGAAAATTISWYGSAGGTMLNVASPSGAGNARQFDPSVCDIKFDCRSLAGIGLLVNSVRNGTFSRLYILSPRTAGVKTTTLGNANLAESSDTQRCVFDRISVRSIDDADTKPAHGLWLTSHSPVGSNSNTSLNVFNQCDMQVWGGSGSGYGLFLEDGDNNTFNNLRVTRAGGTTVESVRIVGNTNCDSNYFWNLSAGGTNGITIKGTTSGFAINPTKNSFWVTDGGNGTQYPTIDSGVLLLWNTDANVFTKAMANQMVVADSEAQARTSAASLGLFSLYVYNGSEANLLLEAGAGKWSVRVMTNGNLDIARVSGTGKLNLPAVAELSIAGADVSYGANDSGGAGYKLLRVPN